MKLLARASWTCRTRKRERVRLKRRVEDADEMALDTRSTKTVRVGTGAP